MRRLALLPLLILPLLAVAAPVPVEKPEAKMKRLFGEVADPKDGYTFALDGDKLVVTMAANASEKEDDFPPRIGQEITGDFEAQVVLDLAPPDKKVENAGKRPYVFAGLVVWGKEGCYVMRARLFSSFGGKEAANDNGWVGARHQRDSVKGGFTGRNNYDEHFREYHGLHIRIRREGSGLFYAESAEGKTWKERGGWEGDLPDTLRVGLIALNTTNAECTATFSDFTVTPLKPAK